MQFLASPAVQAELDSVAVHVEGSSLDVERKHKCDKVAERRTCVGVAAASRDSILRDWRRDAREVQLQAAASACGGRSKAARRARHTNCMSLALRRVPHAFPQAQGRLWWQLRSRGGAARMRESELSEEQRREELRRYMEEHRETLEADLASIRAAAPAAPAAFRHTVPMSKAAWVEWLATGKNGELFRKTLRDARAGARRAAALVRLRGGGLACLGSEGRLGGTRLLCVFRGRVGVV